MSLYDLQEGLSIMTIGVVVVGWLACNAFVLAMGVVAATASVARDWRAERRRW